MSWRNGLLNALATASYWCPLTSPPPLTSSLIQSCLSCKGAASFVGNIRDLLCVSISACRCRRTDIQNESLAHEAVPSRTGAGLIPGFHQKFKVSLISVAPMFAGLRWAAFGYLENVGSQFLSLRHYQILEYLIRSAAGSGPVISAPCHGPFARPAPVQRRLITAEGIARGCCVGDTLVLHGSVQCDRSHRPANRFGRIEC